MTKDVKQVAEIIGTDESRALANQDGDITRWFAWQKLKDAWFESIRRGSGRDNTVKTYRIAVRQFFEWTYKRYDRNVPPWSVNTMMAEEWTIHLDRGRKLAASTINLKLAALTSLYDYARRQGAWPADRINPFRSVKRTKIDEYSRATFPTSAELKKILRTINRETLTGKRDFALLFSFAVTCRRSGELLKLRWGDIDHESLASGHHIYAYEVLKKGADQKRRAILEASVYDAICDYLEAAGRLDRSTDMEPAPDEYVWTPLWPERALRLQPDLDVAEVASSPISNKTANGILKKWARRAGVDEEKAHLHALRHAGARLRVEHMKESGNVDYLEIMRLLEHSSIAVTQIYAERILEDPEDPGAQAAAEALLPGEPE
ncbi:MAG: tyrosine-type recombinase/integrase [bacterium]